MQKKSFSDMQCPIAQSLDNVGEWWSILILRDAFYGMKRFDEFQTSLGVASSTLTRRLNGLVDSGLLERYQYSSKPPRDEYHLTQRGRDFKSVLISLMDWGNQHFPPEQVTVVITDTQTGQATQPILVDQITGKIITEETHAIQRTYKNK
ncbi:winged helix-turn-helix transcriptional regulator [Acinetobacter piscicola]|uniref:winged helix-turn-helix transcriptional regulator n=1 Tax=Acinetobacter piscicola TaxID=2006115 RepID=UPI000B7FFD22|nr:helix-turn-helix domain-containing protein [Acinetobacter piscicola]